MNWTEQIPLCYKINKEEEKINDHSKDNLYSLSQAQATCFGINQSINQSISPSHKTNSRYDVKKCQHTVLPLCCFCAIPQRWNFKVTTTHVRNAHRHILRKMTVVVPLQASQLLTPTAVSFLDLY
jgi:hypothetical protein